MHYLCVDAAHVGSWQSRTRDIPFRPRRLANETVRFDALICNSYCGFHGNPEANLHKHPRSRSSAGASWLGRSFEGTNPSAEEEEEEEEG